MLSNAYFLAKFRFDTAENELAKNLQNFANFPNFANPYPLPNLKRTAQEVQPALTAGAPHELARLRRVTPDSFGVYGELL